MDETLGTRINENRAAEALATGAQTIAAACPFCITMLGDGVSTLRPDDPGVEVTDIAEVLLRAVRPDLDDASPPPQTATTLAPDPADTMTNGTERG